MARGVNKVILIGNLGADPEVRYMPSGGAVANLRLATSESWKDKNTGENVEQTEWHRVVLYNRLGEIAGEYLRKGARVYIEGSLKTRKWQGQDGQDRYTTEIIGREMQMLDSKSSAPSNVPSFTDDFSMAEGPASSSATSRNNDSKKAEPSTFNDFNDDIPF